MTVKTLFIVFLSGAALLASVGAKAGESGLVQSPYFAKPVNSDALAVERGRAAPECASGCTLGSMTATLTGNTANVGAITGSNVIGNSAFANSAGAMVAVQNIGNNVIIQTNMAVDVNLVQP